MMLTAEREKSCGGCALGRLKPTVIHFLRPDWSLRPRCWMTVLKFTFLYDETLFNLFMCRLSSPVKIPLKRVLVSSQQAAGKGNS